MVDSKRIDSKIILPLKVWLRKNESIPSLNSLKIDTTAL